MYIFSLEKVDVTCRREKKIWIFGNVLWIIISIDTTKSERQRKTKKNFNNTLNNWSRRLVASKSSLYFRKYFYITIRAAFSLSLFVHYLTDFHCVYSCMCAIEVCICTYPLYFYNDTWKCWTGKKNAENLFVSMVMYVTQNRIENSS